MKKLKSIFLVVVLISCSNLRQLNNKIYEVQKEQLFQSPYKDAKGTIIKIDAQKRFRLNGLPESIKDKIFYKNGLIDTVLILEDFDEICINCPSQRIQVLYQDTVYYSEKEIVGNKALYKMKRERLNLTSEHEYGYLFQYNELVEIKKKMNKGQNWLNNPLDYGTDDCFDGNPTIITAIYPDKKNRIALCKMLVARKRQSTV